MAEARATEPEVAKATAAAAMASADISAKAEEDLA